MITGKDGRALRTYSKTLERAFASMVYNYIRTTFRQECVKCPENVLEWRFSTAETLRFVVDDSILVDFSNPSYQVESSDLFRLQRAFFREDIPESDAEVYDSGHYESINKSNTDVSCDIKAIDRMICSVIRDDLIQSVGDDFYSGIVLDGSFIESEEQRQAMMRELDRPLRALPRIARAIEARRKNKI